MFPELMDSDLMCSSHSVSPCRKWLEAVNLFINVTEELLQRFLKCWLKPTPSQIASLHTSLEAHQTSASLGGMLSPSQGYPAALNSPVLMYTPGWREVLKVSCPRTQHTHTVFPARARTWTARSGVERTKHDTTAPWTLYYFSKVDNSTIRRSLK